MKDQLNDVQRREVVQYCESHEDMDFDTLAKALSQLTGVPLTRDDVYAMYVGILTMEQSMTTAYYPDYKPKNASKFKELEREFNVCNTVDALKFRVTLYTLDMSYDREDIMVALGRAERAKGWTL